MPRMGGNRTSILFPALWGTFASLGADKEKSVAPRLSLIKWWFPMVSLEDKGQSKFCSVLIWTLQNSGQSAWSLLTNQQEDRFWRRGMDIDDFPLACSPLWLLFPWTSPRHSEAKAMINNSSQQKMKTQKEIIPPSFPSPPHSLQLNTLNTHRRTPYLYKIN